MADGSDDRWTVRGVPAALRGAAAEAAQRRKVTVGAWLCQAIDREVAAERAPLELKVAGPVAAMSAELSAADVRLALIERAVASAVSLAAAPGVPSGFRWRANRLLRESLPDPALRVLADKPRLALVGSGD
jgi:hypothetical protein